MQKDKRRRVQGSKSPRERKNKVWLSAHEVKKFEVEWPKNLTETDKGSWFSQSSLLTLDPLPSSFTAGYVSQ